jgi:hypothetical protein
MKTASNAPTKNPTCLWLRTSSPCLTAIKISQPLMSREV